ncbi:MAG: hypothetical protein ACD_50C00375G0002 [uncultured bacterium]|uniref:NH(3)-dependent NAD(+) synthetase n=1 Tax=Candidatus Gottesmanbacteria bacterium RIFCSPLOWO2_01_FULL_43_11b TaxID=1798392 RepID=A0A1F6AII0_9BACT|nr:MAG: hypothetical protein ACD_50C00375G0002 [uncultured bacterium]OGG24087.1 MAG: NAD(+) synthase [Candidatus Gottesmanbacteria bacterium RIFCSPLOWO2_01_FULL_43_11b]
MNSINPEKTAAELTSFIKNAFDKAGFTKAVIGVSGGVDSATSHELTKRALGEKNVFPYFLPYEKIKPIVDQVVSLDPGMDRLRQGNIMARVRMTILFDQAKKRQALVVGTENKTEHILGYYTRFGDSASDIEPLRNLYKTQVYQLAKYLGIPDKILNKAPTAGLWEGQTDEGEFGFTYKDADEVLFQLYDLKKDNVEGVDPGVVEKVKSRVSRNAFKHSLPILPFDY